MGRHALRLDGEDFQNGFKRPRERGTRRTPAAERAMKMQGRPGDQRAFVHKKLLGIGAKLAGVLPIPGSGLIQTGLSFLGGRGGGGGPVRIGRPAPRATVSRTTTARVSRFSEREKAAGTAAKFGGDSGLARGAAPGGGCVWPWRRDPDSGQCKIFAGDRVGPDGNGDRNGGGAVTPFGDAVMGRYGAGEVPASMVIDRAVCRKGMRLGDDGLCYAKTQISNKQRMWPRGRRPLLTGGDMRAISIAARSGKRLDDTAGKLRGMGLMKPLPKPRKSKAHAHAVPARAVSVS